MRKTVLAIARTARCLSARPALPLVRALARTARCLSARPALPLGGALLVLLAGAAAQAQEAPGGRRGTGLPVPRYVSLKTDRVNLREGPSKDHRTAWVFQRAGLPVEIVAEYETWRRIRDAEGTEGWVLHSLLSGRRTAQVMPWAKGEAPPIPLREAGEEKSGVVARLQPGVIVSVKQCSGAWCRVMVVMDGARDLDGFIRQDRLWGVYPDERFE